MAAMFTMKLMSSLRKVLNMSCFTRAVMRKKVVTLGFEEVRGAAFAAVESGVTDGDGYCKENNELMQVIAQCEGDLGPCDCGKCVSIAFQIAQEECGTSLSGQFYLDTCFISYGPMVTTQMEYLTA
ncbi:hypothetical protein REPUB_Repub16aG0107200 [Reevesia pubescens]